VVVTVGSHPTSGSPILPTGTKFMYDNAKYCREYYRKNKEAAKKRKRRAIEKRLKQIRAAKDKPCADCGIKYSYWIMQFDHVRGVKLFNIGQKVWKLGIANLMKEILKCDVVCANCHAERTYRRTNGEFV
jgi:hypothetical protein